MIGFMPETAVQIVLLVFLILLNGFFAFSELALVSARKEKLLARGSKDQGAVKALLKLLENPNGFLSTIQIGITLIGILSGAVGGMALVSKLAPLFVRWGVPTRLAHDLAFVLIVGSITYLSIVLGELIPKRAAMTNPERFALLVARPMRFLSHLFSPVERLLSASVRFGMRLLGIRSSQEQPLSMDEIRVVIDQARIGGLVHAEEQDIVEGVFKFSDLYLAALVTPRTELVWLDINDSPEEMETVIRANRHNWLPVAEDNLDNVTGMLNIKDFYEQDILHYPERLRSILFKPLFLPENTLAVKALEQMKALGITHALVLDEYGGLLGLVTLMDVFESMVGEFVNQDDSNDRQVFQRSDGSFLIDGLMEIQEVKKLLKLDELPEEDKIGYQTMAGFVIQQLGRIPATGEKFTYGQYDFEVVDMDSLRIDKVLVSITNL